MDQEYIDELDRIRDEGFVENWRDILAFDGHTLGCVTPETIQKMLNSAVHRLESAPPMGIELIQNLLAALLWDPKAVAKAIKRKSKDKPPLAMVVDFANLGMVMAWAALQEKRRRASSAEETATTKGNPA